MSENEQIEVKDNADRQRYEVHVDGHLAELIYEREGDTITFLHTGVPPALEGKGIAGALARTALEEARARHLSVIALCPFVASYIRRHEQYQSLLTPEERERILQK